MTQLKREKCSDRETKFLRKNFFLFSRFISSLLKINEHGLSEREKWRVYTKKPVCSSSTNQFVSVGLIDCYMALMILGYGIGASVLLFVAEHVIRRRLRKLSFVLNID